MQSSLPRRVAYRGLRTMPFLSSLHARRRQKTAAARDRALASRHLESSQDKKLHIGCGDNVLEDWLNSDSPGRLSVMNLDATKPFPFADCTFDYIFSEHMIEHLTYLEGLRMLEECHRVLKPGGRIRISTPDLQFLLRLYNREKSDLQLDYIAWAFDTFIRTGIPNDTTVINNFVRDWQHLFIYDEKTLRSTLELAGFVDIDAFLINQSDHPALRSLENVTRMPEGFLELESLTLEAARK